MRLGIQPTMQFPGKGLLLVIVILLATSGCNSILATEDRMSDTVVVEITGTSAGPLTLVTSTNWTIGTDLNSGVEVVAVHDSTVSDLTLPFNHEYTFTSTHRFLVRVVNPDTMQDATVRLRVLIDGKVVNDKTGTLRSQPLQFTWRYF